MAWIGNVLINTFFDIIGLFILLAHLELDEGSCKARRNLVFAAIITIALHAYQIQIDRLHFISIQPGTESKVFVVSFAAFFSAYGILYFVGQLFREIKKTGYEFVDKTSEGAPQIINLFKQNGPGNSCNNLPPEMNEQEKAENRKLKYFLPYAFFTLVVEIAFPIILGIWAVRMSWQELSDLAFRLSALI